MEFLRKHTAEEFDQMPEDVYTSYMESLEELCYELGINVGGHTNPFGTEMEMEDRVICILEKVKTRKTFSGTKLSQMPNSGSRNVRKTVQKTIDKCRNELIAIVKKYIDKGTLILGKTLKQKDEWGDVYTFTEICCQQFEDEIVYLCPDKTGSYDESYWLNLEDLHLDTLLQIVTLIKDDKAVSYTTEELIYNGRGIEDTKLILLNSPIIENV